MGSPFLAQLHQDLPALQLPRIDYSAIMPELILIGLALVLMTGAALTRRRLPRGTYAIFTVAASGASMAYAYLLWNHALVFALAIGLLTLEWVLRKSRHLL